MIQSGYTKLFGTIVASTVWNEDHPTRIVWITLLALSDRDGYVAGSIPGLATLARVSVEDCKRALDKLQQPDEYSRSPEHHGRRIEAVAGGWFILNRAKYRNLCWEDDRAERHRLANKRYYQNQKSKASANSDRNSDTHNPIRIDSDRFGDKKKENKKKESKTISSEPNKSASEPVASVITLPCVGKGHTEYPVTRQQVSEWSECFPGVDVLAQLRHMRAWLEANPNKRKTAKGVPRFIVSWLGRQQNSALATTAHPATNRQEQQASKATPTLLVDTTPVAPNPKMQEVLKTWHRDPVSGGDHDD